MKVLLITVGSRGDVEPFIALADHLAHDDHEVDLFVQKDLIHLAPHADGSEDDTLTSKKMKVHELSYSMMDSYKYVGNPSHGANHENPRVRFIGIVTDVIAELVFPSCNQVLETATSSGTEIIVTSALTRPLAIAISQKLNIPVCIVYYQALVPTSLFPHYSRVDDCVDAIIGCANGNKMPLDTNHESTAEKNLTSYWELEKYQYDFLEDRLNERVYEALQVPPITFDELKQYLTGTHKHSIVANAFSSQIIPQCPDYQSETKGSGVFDIGALADNYIPRGWNPPVELCRFLEGSCDSADQTGRPICIGYGSMPFDKPDIILDALMELDQKAILVGTAFKNILTSSNAEQNGDEKRQEQSNWINANICQVDSVPYPWLLPKCSMLLCHGGAGTIHAALRAGIPLVISPLMGDQFLHAKLLQKLKLGHQAGNVLGQITKADVKEAIQIVTNEEYKFNSKKIGEKIRSPDYYEESSPKTLTNILEHAVKSG